MEQPRHTPQSRRPPRPREGFLSFFDAAAFTGFIADLAAGQFSI
jgi:hypothetical protein